MTIADRIRQRRHELSLSQTELATRAEYYDKTRISKIENSGNDISMKQVRRIAKALGVTSAYLMGWEDDEDVTAPSAAHSAEDEAARALYEKYKSAPPDVQSVVERLLKNP